MGDSLVLASKKRKLEALATHKLINVNYLCWGLPKHTEWCAKPTPSNCLMYAMSVSTHSLALVVSRALLES